MCFERRDLQIRSELKALDEELEPLRRQYQDQRDRVEELQLLHQQLEAVQLKIQYAERMQNRAALADLRYAQVPKLENRIAELEVQLQKVGIQASWAVSATHITASL